jgi:Predicted metal-binding, possibly nucleic acid-binding protein
VFISVTELELHKVHFKVDFPAGELDFLDKVRQSGPLHAEGDAELVSDVLGEIRIKGSLNVAMDTECDRCLEPVKLPITSDFDLIYRPATAVTSSAHEVQIVKGESEIGFYEGAGIELGEVLCEHILLSLPMQLICSEGCLGICPQCGQNRNLGGCTCAPKLADDRWAALRDIKSGLRAES